MSPRDPVVTSSGEPTFTLYGRGPLAGFLVSIWASAHQGDGEAVAAKIAAMLDRFTPGLDGPTYERAQDAVDVAMAMFAWRKAHEARPACTAGQHPTTEGSSDAEGPSCAR